MSVCWALVAWIPSVRVAEWGTSFSDAVGWSVVLVSYC